MGNYAGIDWASTKHDVLVEDRAGEELVGPGSPTTRLA
jgi:hypothetical protein